MCAVFSVLNDFKVDFTCFVGLEISLTPTYAHKIDSITKFEVGKKHLMILRYDSFSHVKIGIDKLDIKKLNP